jgi:hypothetical protein
MDGENRLRRETGWRLRWKLTPEERRYLCGHGVVAIARSAVFFWP